MDKSARIFVAGHRGLVGSALMRGLSGGGWSDLLVRSSSELDLRDAAQTARFFEENKPEYVFLAAAKVGGIIANHRYPVDFLSDNLNIQNSVINAAYANGVKRLMFLGSSCIYPKLATQPMNEKSLLTGALEPTNRAYALAKIAGIEMCWSYNRQYETQYLAVMPTNLYGPGDNYHPENSHVIPGLLRKFHEAKEAGAPAVSVWGSGKPRREFLYSDDMAGACIYLMQLSNEKFEPLLGSDEVATGEFNPPLVNIGVGDDVTISELAQLIREVVGYEGQIEYDASKPDGTPRKLMDVAYVNSLGWKATTPLREGLQQAYDEFRSNSAVASR